VLFLQHAEEVCS